MSLDLFSERWNLGMPKNVLLFSHGRIFGKKIVRAIAIAAE
jgi:hypothetical protein